MASKSDKDLVQDFIAGDQAAFDALVRRHQDRIYRLACAKLYSREDAVDVAQEVFLRAYNGLPRFRFQAEPFTWLYRTLENTCNEYNRRVMRHNKIASSLEQDVTGNYDDNTGEGNIYMQQINALVRQLPKRQQDVVLLRIFEGMSVEETAVALKCRAGTVKAHLHKAINNLREYLGDMDIKVSDYE